MWCHGNCGATVNISYGDHLSMYMKVSTTCIIYLSMICSESRVASNPTMRIAWLEWDRVDKPLFYNCPPHLNIRTTKATLLYLLLLTLLSGCLRASLESQSRGFGSVGGVRFGRYLDEYMPKYGWKRSDLVSYMHMTLDMIIFIHIWAYNYQSTAQTFSGALARP